jgi:hypothetical protein
MVVTYRVTTHLEHFMGNTDRTKGTPDSGETQKGSEKERSRETQPAGQPRTGQGSQSGQGMQNEGRVTGDEDEGEGEGDTMNRPNEKSPKQYVSGEDDRSKS